MGSLIGFEEKYCAEELLRKRKSLNLVIVKAFCGEKGIRTLGTQSVQRFSRPPRSTTPASLLGQKKSDLRRLAETEGFEPPKPFGLTVFKTAAIDHSAISPLQKYKIYHCCKFFCEKKLFFQNDLLFLVCN